MAVQTEEESVEAYQEKINLALEQNDAGELLVLLLRQERERYTLDALKALIEHQNFLIDNFERTEQFSPTYMKFLSLVEFWSQFSEHYPIGSNFLRLLQIHKSMFQDLSSTDKNLLAASKSFWALTRLLNVSHVQETAFYHTFCQLFLDLFKWSITENNLQLVEDLLKGLTWLFDRKFPAEFYCHLLTLKPRFLDLFWLTSKLLPFSIFDFFYSIEELGMCFVRNPSALKKLPTEMLVSLNAILGTRKLVCFMDNDHVQCVRAFFFEEQLPSWPETEIFAAMRKLDPSEIFLLYSQATRKPMQVKNLSMIEAVFELIHHFHLGECLGESDCEYLIYNMGLQSHLQDKSLYMCNHNVQAEMKIHREFYILTE